MVGLENPLHLAILLVVLLLVVLTGIVRVARGPREGRFEEAQLEARLQQRGLMSRLCGRRFQLIRSSWQMYPVGLLFGLGFDTAAEVGLLAITAGVATSQLPPLAIVALPTLFAAGMTTTDTLDGLFMTKAYGWAFSSPARKVYYNLTVTSVSVVVALLVGSVELLQALGHGLGLSGPFWSWLGALDFSTLGYSIVGLFVLTWIGALALWWWGRIEERWQAPRSPTLAAKTADP